MSSDLKESESDISSKKRPPEDSIETDSAAPFAKKVKLVEEDEDDFGPSLPSSATLGGSSSAPRDTKSEWERVRSGEADGPVSAVEAMLSSSDRAEWMTMLPPERSERKELDFDKMQQNVTTFSRRGVQRRGDTSSWTDTPQQRALREAGNASMSSLDMAKQMAAQRFRKEEDLEARATSASFNADTRGMSLYEQVKTGAIQKSSKPSPVTHSDSESDDASSSSSRSERKHRHKDKHKSKHKHRDKDKRRHKDKDKHKEKEKRKSDKRFKALDEQTPRALSTAEPVGSGFWDRERDLVRFGNRDSERTRAQTFRDAAMLNTRFYSGGTASGPANLR